MLNVWFGYREDAILSIDSYFNNTFEDKWLSDDLVKRMIEDIDGSKVLSEYCIQSPVLGQIPPERLSGGVKALICMYKDEECFLDLIVCGENCEHWIKEIGSKVDVKVSVSGYDLLFKDGIVCKCMNDGDIVRNHKDWVLKLTKYMR